MSSNPDTLVLTLPDGRTTNALLFSNDGIPRPGLIVVHEWWGVNEDIRDQAVRFSREGFTALVPDLYFGKTASAADQAEKLSSEMKTSVSMQIIGAAVRALATDPRTTGRVGVTGFCLGGAMALAAACTIPGLLAAVPFYGTPRDEFIRFSKETPPIQGHYAKEDVWVDADRVERIRKSALDAGATFEIYFYDAGHAFLRRGDPTVYDAPSADAAWGRAAAFLRRHLGA
jgi:carboxymethylenebutenolidase